MPGALTLTAAPATPAVGLTEAKEWAHIDTGDNDATLLSMIAGAQAHLGDLHGYSGLAFVTQTYSWLLDAFPCGGCLELPRWPVQEVTGITYIDAAGAQQTWAPSSYLVDVKSMPARITPAYGQSWPSARAQMGAVSIAFTAGFGDGAAVPEPLRNAIKALAAWWHEHREAVGETPEHVKALVNPYRLHMGVG